MPPKVCLRCRKPGHAVRDCPEAPVGQRVNQCYNCGSRMHRLRDCPRPRDPALPFAQCYVCGETGHLSGACPQNQKGVYPNGGCCRMCGSVFHKKEDCPQKGSKREREAASCALLDVQPPQKRTTRTATTTTRRSGDADVTEGPPTGSVSPMGKRKKPNVVVFK